MSHYADYIREREGKETVEDARGFATYSILQDGVYIQEIYVRPEYRKEGVASHFADVIAGVARAKGYKKLFGSVCPSARGSTESLKVLLGYGFKLVSSETNFVWFVKEIS